MTFLKSHLNSILHGRLLYAWLFWAFSMMSNAFVGVMLQRYVSERDLDKRESLFDFGFQFLPYISSSAAGLAIPDLCSILSASLIALGLVLQFQPAMASIVLRRVLFISAIAYAGRAVSVPMTLLPNPDPDCIPQLFDSMTLSVLLVPFGGAITCSDVFYSGHTIPITCAMLVWWDYMRESRLRYLGLVVCTVSIFGIIATHFHYTIDVFYGFLVTLVVWRLYHFSIICPSVFEHFPALRWWESDGSCADRQELATIIPGVIQQDFSRDPRLLWSFAEKPKTIVTSRLTRSQLVLLVIVGLTLSPSWIAVYHKSSLR